MTKKQIRRAVNIYMAGLLYHTSKDFPDWLASKDREVFLQECEARAHDVLERVRAPVIPMSLERSLQIARDEERL